MRPYVKEDAFPDNWTVEGIREKRKAAREQEDMVAGQWKSLWTTVVIAVLASSVAGAICGAGITWLILR